MGVTNVYWSAPQVTQTSMAPISGHFGFHMDLPYPDPVSAGWFDGQGNENIYGKREQVLTSLPELFTVGGNIMPFTSGVPRVDPKGFAARVSRSAMTLKV